MKYIKKLMLVSLVILAIACENTPKQASIQGKIANLPKEVSEVILRTKDQVKNIKIEDGFFKDTISIEDEFAYLQIGQFGKTLFLDKNTHLVINADANDYQKTLTYTGKGKNVNNYLNKRELITQKVFENIDSINGLNANDFEKYVQNLEKDIQALLTKNKSMNTIVLDTENDNLTIFLENLKKQYNAINGLDENLKKGDLSPQFEHYENYKGGTTSLSDLKGSYVYIDIWATWCPPCKAEIPYLKELEQNFKKKNIKFVSISVDSPNAKNQWKSMIADKKMGGIQLFANGDQSFMDAYQVEGIPRFILLDTEGKIMMDNAPRPSNPETKKLLKNLP
ncbi:TlpA family protein disulfide reductase [Wenyingzhuangia sp. IMCC45533]